MACEVSTEKSADSFYGGSHVFDFLFSLITFRILS